MMGSWISWLWSVYPALRRGPGDVEVARDGGGDEGLATLSRKSHRTANDLHELLDSDNIASDPSLLTNIGDGDADAAKEIPVPEVDRRLTVQRN